jgi:glucose-1-phosphate cytidylyltransferase
VLQEEIFQEIVEGEELVIEPFRRLAARKRLFGMPYSGFFGCMDTFKEKQCLDDLHRVGNPPWEVWSKRTAGRNGHAPALASNGSSNGWMLAESRR